MNKQRPCDTCANTISVCLYAQEWPGECSDNGYRDYVERTQEQAQYKYIPEFGLYKKLAPEPEKGDT